ncbi:MAG TPA: A24 family peptidase [Gemmatales bacterium]|nr:A24 family peptidase [Gemmatales bacterium]
MTPPFFPDTQFGWLFYGLLVACCLAAVVTDLKWQRLPNYITVPTFALGLVMNLVRSIWLGNNGEPGLYFGLTGTLGGVIEGLCFALAGFVVAFAVFVVLLILKKCGAGDVKLMAAIGAWVGPVWFFFVFAGTIVAVLPILLAWWCYAFAMKKNPGLKLSYALPALISTALMMLWLWRKTLLV